jgi:hypothetical protein
VRLMADRAEPLAIPHDRHTTPDALERVKNATSVAELAREGRSPNARPDAGFGTASVKRRGTPPSAAP